MKAKLKPLSKKEINKIKSRYDFIEIKKNDPIFIITNKSESLDNNPLINLEISFRKCERLGVFKK